MLNREPAPAEDDDPNPRLPNRELENAELLSEALPADDLPNCRLSKFDIARADEIDDPADRDAFIVPADRIEPTLAFRPALAMLLESEATAPQPRDALEDAPLRVPPKDVHPPAGVPVPLADVSVRALPPLTLRDPAELALVPVCAEPNECHAPSAIAGRADDRPATLLKPPRDPARP